ncbi:hypothetical protein BH09VER1_BH09VER1_22070 [soil metagenome]
MSSPNGSPERPQPPEEALEQLAEQRRLALDTAQMGWWSLDLVSGSVHWDERIRSMFALNREHLDYLEVLPLLHPEDRDRLDRSIKASIDPINPQPYAIEYRIVRPDGAIRWLVSKGKVYFEGHGDERRAVNIAGTAVDITDAKEAQDALRESEARFRFLSELGEATRDLDDPEEVMATVTRMLGEHMNVSCCAYADVEADSDRFTIRHDYTNGMGSIVGNFHLSLFGTRAANDQRSGRVFVMHDLEEEYSAMEGLDAFNGLGVKATVCCPLVKAGRLVAMMAVHQKTPRRWSVQEVSLVEAVVERSWAYIERARDARELKRSEAEFRQLADAMPQIVWAAGPDGTVDYYNQQWYAYTGKPPGSISTDCWASIVDPDDAQQADEAWTEALEHGEPYENEYRLKRGSDGMYRWHLGRALPFKDCSGRIVRWLGTDTDIHDKKMLEKENQDLFESERLARLEAERQGRTKDDFLATLSHELRTPLNAILGWAELLHRGKVKPEDQAAGLEVISRNARTQAEIIEDLLDMSRIVSGKLRLDIQQVDLATVINDAVDTVRSAANAKEIELHTSFDPLAFPISGDPQRLQQIIWNLVNNAIKFTPKGGAVMIRLQGTSTHLEITVQDTGEGIKPSFLPLVFDRFHQADPSSTRRHGGLGLGLAIVKQLTELHGGTVSASSPGAGLGATFVVRLPVASAISKSETNESRKRHRSDALPSIPNTPSLRGISVLLVDDEPDARALVKRILEDFEATVETAASARDAVTFFLNGAPTVLVSDIGMPGEDGHELIRQIRKIEEAQGGHVPALALTAYARSEDKKLALASGFQMHVAKPVEPHELILAVASLARAAN